MKLEIDKKWLLWGGIGAIVLITLGIVLWQVSSGDDSSKPASEAEINELAEEFEDDEEEVFKACMTLWNGEGNESARQAVSVMEASYASVTLSSLYPDRCLVTVANPQLDLAAQFLEGDLEGEEGEMTISFERAGGGSASTLDPTVTNWNLVVANEGALWLKSQMEDPEF